MKRLTVPSSVKPRVVFSRCLGFACCRFDGMCISDEFVDKLREQVECITVCPETEIGLSVPRDPIRKIHTLQGRILLQPATGRNLTGEMQVFSAAFLDSLPMIDGFILKGRSPSCGIKDVKQFSPEGEIIGKGTGFFGEAVIKRFPHLAVEDEGRLKDRKNREHFLVKIFAFARLREAVPQGTMSVLLRFHSENKLLLMAYNRKVFSELDRLLANPGGKKVEEVMAAYEQTFRKAFVKISSRVLLASSHIKGIPENLLS